MQLASVPKLLTCFAHNPHLLEAGFDRKRTRVPWLGGRHLQLIFG